MQIPLRGARSEALRAVAARLDEAGFEVQQHSELLWVVTARDGQCEAFLRAEAAAQDPLVTVWLPDEGDAAATERLICALLPPADEPQAPDENMLRRLRRIEGQIRGVQRMVETGRECDAVLTQLSAVTAALRQTAALLVSAHLVECIRAEIDLGSDLSTVNQRLLKILF